MNAAAWIRSIARRHTQGRPWTAADYLKTAKKIAVALVIEAVAAVAISCSPIPALGQPAAVTEGDQVRVRWRPRSSFAHAVGGTRLVVAEVVDHGSSTLLVRRGNQLLWIPMASVSSLERRIGTKPSTAPAMVAGSAIGFLAGFAAGAFRAYIDQTVEGEGVVDGGIVGGVLLGAPAGALVAYLSSRQRGIYERVSLHAAPEVAWSPDRGMGISLRLPTS